MDCYSADNIQYVVKNGSKKTYNCKKRSVFVENSSSMVPIHTKKVEIMD